MFSISVRKLDSLGGGFLASRRMGKSVQGGSLFTPSLKHYDIATSYTIHEDNGNPPTTVNVNFPSDKYTALDYTPVKNGYRFAGWSAVQNDPPYDAEVEYLESTGSQYIDTGIDSPESGWFRVSAEANPNYGTVIPIGVNGDATTGQAYRKRWIAVMDGVKQTWYYDCGTAKERVAYSGSLLMDTGKQPFEIVLNSSKRVYLFSVNPVSSTGQRFYGKVFAAQLWDEDGTLLMDIHPVRVGLVGYMHDRVSNSLLHTIGREALIVGPDMRAPNINVSDNVLFNTGTVYASWQPLSNITFDATTNGGQMPPGWVSPNYYGGQRYETLPKPTKDGEVFVGWFIGSSTSQITESSIAVHGSATLVARYAAVTYDTSFQVTTTSSYRKTGIYSATSRNASNPTVVDWGDGTTDVVYGNISQLTHTYSSNGTFTVQVNDNISDIALSSNNSTWYNTTSQNRYTVKKLTALGANITALPSAAFMYCSAMTDALLPSNASFKTIPQNCFAYCSVLKPVAIPSTVTTITDRAFQYITGSQFSSVTIPATITSIGQYAFCNCNYLKNIIFEESSSALTLGTYAFAYCFYQSSAVGTIDLSARKITSIPNYCFYYCRYLKGITCPQGLTSIGRSAFQYCFYYAASTGTVEIPEGVTSISGTYAFGNCLYLTAVTLPSTLTSLNNYTFYYCTRLATITSNRSTAPTVSAATFGNGTTYYTGRTSYSAGTNKLYVPAGATGYNASYWSSVLLDSTKCGFTLEEME